VASDYEQERKGFWREDGDERVPEEVALQAWAASAHDALVRVAGDYHATISETDLAARVQDDSGVRTTRPPARWMRKLLGRMAVVYAAGDEPMLTTLVVDGAGQVGERHDDVALALDDVPITGVREREASAARMRLDCYRWAGSAPADGGVPAALPSRRTSRPAARTTTPREPRGPRAPRATSPRPPAAPPAPRRVAASDRPVAVCPRCFMALPATGICDTCD